MISLWMYCLLLIFEIKQETIACEVNVPDKARENYYGMGVENAWANGYTGEGVVVGITGVGVDTELADLKENINKDWSYNFVRNNTNMAAEHFYAHPEFDLVTNHGNNVASIIGATKDNNICSAGIAYLSTIVVLKIYEYTLTDKLEMFPKHWTKSDVTARALVHRLDDIDILVLTMSPNMPFQRIYSATREAFAKGVKTGRKGLGRIYVVSAGAIGNEVTNNDNTITVNGIGRSGTIPKEAYRDTSVLTAGLTEGNNLTSEYMFTTSFDDDCIVRFSGVSAATSQVAAIIALALQANPDLSARSIQHLIVRSCHVSGMNESDKFRRNAAGRYYHPYFGFGLLNATTLVTNARNLRVSWKHLSIQIESLDDRTSKRDNTLRYSFCHDCNDTHNSSCITEVEYVGVIMDLKTNAKRISIMVTSPSGTLSLFLKNEKVLNGKISGRLVSANFWDESASGQWQLKISSKGTSPDVLHANLTKVSMELYGTARNQYFFKGKSCLKNSRNTKWGTDEQAKPLFERIHPFLTLIITLSMMVIIFVFTTILCINQRQLS